MRETIKVIDLFAGPGGLGEGFSASSTNSGRPFKIACSVEKEAGAHQTLTLRAFYRHCQVQFGSIPADYYDYLRGRMSHGELFARHPEAARNALRETLGQPRALGEHNGVIYAHIAQALEGYTGPWVLIGGPPCQAYSLVGRSRNQGISGYRIEDDPRSGLYREYLQIVHRFGPDVFIMENVKGILSAKLDGQNVMDRVLEDLSHPSAALHAGKVGPRYQIFSLNSPRQDLFGGMQERTDFAIRAENYGVPQTRHRVILLGVRDDVPVRNMKFHLSPQERLKTAEIIGGLPRLRSGLSKEQDDADAWIDCLRDQASQIRKAASDPAISASLLAEVDAAGRSWKRPSKDRGGRFVEWSRNQNPTKLLPSEMANWLVDHRLGGVVNHESRGHLRSDLGRYLFAVCKARELGAKEFRSPKLQDFPQFLMPEHANRDSGKFADRFRVQNPHGPAATITSHISKDGHYYIHYDPSQVRSLTVREAARLQTFPDNYFFEGNRTQQFVQVGNAVPPLLARQISDIVYKLVAGS